MADDTVGEGKLDAFWDFSGRLAVVTGGRRGIGLTIAQSLAARGCRVHALARGRGPDPTNLLSFHSVDVAESAAVAAFVGELESPATLLVNCAGITRDRSLAKMSDEEWREVLDINLTGTFNLIRALVPGMVEAGGGRIVNITSINGLRGKFGQANYSASKAGIIGLTKTAARELGRKGVTVNAVAPGLVMTDMAREMPQEFVDKALSEAVLERLPDAADGANTVLFLLSDAARAITGQVVQVDSGQYI